MYSGSCDILLFMNNDVNLILSQYYDKYVSGIVSQKYCSDCCEWWRLITIEV